MPGITAYSAYIPRHRLARETIAAAWGTRAAPGAKAVLHFDEDSLTMAQTAAWRLLATAGPADALYFASTTSPYWQRSAASLVAAVCDLPPETATADFGGSLRCGTTALLAALDAAAARRTLVVASDSREGAPESDEELSFGDAAAAVAVGNQAVIAEVVARASRSDDFMDEWRRDADRYVNSFSSKFSQRRGYEANLVAVVRALLEGAGISPKQISRAALPFPEAAGALGLHPEAVERSGIGQTGAAAPLLLLAQALDCAAPGEVILVAGYGDGADGLLLRVTGEIERLPRPLLGPEPCPIACPSYTVYRKLREFLRTRAGGAEISNVLWEREEPQNIRLHGTLCPRCGLVQFPMTRVCAGCRATDGLVEKPLARTGRVFTFTKDYLYEAPVQPTIMAVVDLDGGGRFLCQMTDAEERQAEIGMPVELVLRRMREGAAMHHYYWKCRPCETK